MSRPKCAKPHQGRSRRSNTEAHARSSESVGGIPHCHHWRKCLISGCELVPRRPAPKAIEKQTVAECAIAAFIKVSTTRALSSRGRPLPATRVSLIVGLRGRAESVPLSGARVGCMRQARKQERSQQPFFSLLFWVDGALARPWTLPISCAIGRVDCAHGARSRPGAHGASAARLPGLPGSRRPRLQAMSLW